MFAALAAAAAFAGEAGAPATPAADCLARLAARRDSISSLQGTATLTVYGAAAGTFTVAFAYVPPARGRLEVSGPLGGAALVVTVADGKLLAYDNATRVAAVGPDGPGTLGAVLGVDVGVGLADLLAWLAARPPPGTGVSAAAEFRVNLEKDAGGATTLVWRRLADDVPIQQLTLAAEPGRFAAARLFRRGRAVVDVTYDDWRELDGVPMPHVITVKTEDVVVDVKVRRLAVNVAVAEGAFATAPPAAALEVVPLSAGEESDDGSR